MKVKKRSGRSNARKRSTINQLPWAQLTNRLKPTEVLSADEVEYIHQSSLRLLAEMGMEMHDPKARAVLKDAGCKVDESTTRVYFDPAFIEEQIAKAPSEFTLRARNPEHNLAFGGNNINFTSVIGPAYCSDLDQGRRRGNTKDVRDYVRLLQSINTVHLISGTPFEAMDIPPEVRHLEGYYNGIELTDKVWTSWLLGRERAQDGIDMACIMFDTDKAGLKERPACIGNINTNSPLILDTEMSQGAMTFAEHGQAVVVTPFTLSGAMAPATISGALMGQNAEALACIALLQTINPGTPCIYGSFTSNVDMRTGSPAFGTPEFAMGAFASGQLARRHNLPWRSSNACAANTVDAQAAYESQMSIWSTVMSHCNMVVHGAGWMEGGLTASFEKLIIDAEMLQMISYMLRPIDTSESAMGIEAYKEAGHGGHFFGTTDTLSRYETAFYNPLVSDWRNYENWHDDGAQTTDQRANKVWKQLLDEYKLPEIDPAILGRLREFVDRRKQETLGDAMGS